MLSINISAVGTQCFDVTNRSVNWNLGQISLVKATSMGWDLYWIYCRCYIECYFLFYDNIIFGDSSVVAKYLTGQHTLCLGHFIC